MKLNPNYLIFEIIADDILNGQLNLVGVKNPSSLRINEQNET